MNGAHSFNFYDIILTYKQNTALVRLDCNMVSPVHVEHHLYFQIACFSESKLFIWKVGPASFPSKPQSAYQK